MTALLEYINLYQERLGVGTSLFCFFPPILFPTYFAHHNLFYSTATVQFYNDHEITKHCLHTL